LGRAQDAVPARPRRYQKRIRWARQVPPPREGLGHFDPGDGGAGRKAWAALPGARLDLLQDDPVRAQGDAFDGLDVDPGHPEVVGDFTELGGIGPYLGLVAGIAGRGEARAPAETPVVNDVAAVTSALMLASRTAARDRLSSLTSGLISLARPV